MGRNDRQEHGLSEQLLALVEAGDVVEGDVWILVDAVSFECLDEVDVGASTIWIVVLDESLALRLASLVSRRIGGAVLLLVPVGPLCI